MSKTNEQILATFKKANKAARERMAVKAGFKTADEYKADLEGNKKPKKKVGWKKSSKRKPVIHIVNILDVSSSMNWGGDKIGAALNGINSEIVELKTDKDIDYIYTLVKFSWDYNIETVVSRVPLSDVGVIKAKADGGTALYDAIGLTLTQVRKETLEGERVLVKIFTDGEENRSQKYTSGAIEKLVEECKVLGYTITFVGTNSDIKKVVKQLAVDSSNTLIHDNTARGVQMSFSASTAATKSYSQKVLKNEDVLTGFYKSTNETL